MLFDICYLTRTTCRLLGMEFDMNMTQLIATFAVILQAGRQHLKSSLLEFLQNFARESYASVTVNVNHISLISLSEKPASYPKFTMNNMPQPVRSTKVRKQKTKD